MSTTDDPDLTQLVSLYQRFRDPVIDERSASSMFGHPITQTARRWTLRPQTALTGIRSVILRLDDVRPERTLLDTVEFELDATWNVTGTTLSNRFRGTLSLMPIGPSADPHRTLKIEHEREQASLPAEARFELVLGSSMAPSTELQIERIVFRRFFPDAL